MRPGVKKQLIISWTNSEHDGVMTNVILNELNEFRCIAVERQFERGQLLKTTPRA